MALSALAERLDSCSFSQLLIQTVFGETQRIVYQCCHIHLDFCAFSSAVSDVFNSEKLFQVRVHSFHGGPSFVDEFPIRTASCGCTVSSEIIDNLDFVDLLAFTLRGKRAGTAFLWCRELDGFIGLIITVVSVGILFDANGSKMFIASNRNGFPPSVVGDNAGDAHPVQLHVDRFVIISSIHGRIGQLDIRKALLELFEQRNGCLTVIEVCG